MTAITPVPKAFTLCNQTQQWPYSTNMLYCQDLQAKYLMVFILVYTF